MIEERLKIIILGGKGTAVNIAEAIVDAQINYDKKIEFLGFAFDDPQFENSINNFPILCGTDVVKEKFSKYEDVKFIFQMHHQDKMYERSKLIDSYNIPIEKWATFIHPSTYFAKSSVIGSGSVILPNSVIHSNVKIGKHCTLSALTTVGHDTEIGNNVFTATHVCLGSNGKYGDFLFFGQNSTVSDNVRISQNNLIGLGASVIKNIEDYNGVYIGTPATKLKDLK